MKFETLKQNAVAISLDNCKAFAASRSTASVYSKEWRNMPTPKTAYNGFGMVELFLSDEVSSAFFPLENSDKFQAVKAWL